jgi:hypothetical protein
LAADRRNSGGFGESEISISIGQCGKPVITNWIFFFAEGIGNCLSRD